MPGATRRRASRAGALGLGAGGGCSQVDKWPNHDALGLGAGGGCILD